MSHGPPSSGFGVYLKETILAARLPTPTHVARAVGIDPSVVLRWLSEEQRPTIRSIERIAPALGKTIHEMVQAAYPDMLETSPRGDVPQLHPLAYEIGRILSGDSPLPTEDRHALESVLERLVDPYRKLMRRR